MTKNNSENERALTGIGVIFDMDGVLVDSYSAHLESWRRLAFELSTPITEAQFASTFGRTSRDIIRELFGSRSVEEARRLDEHKEALYRDLIRGRVPEMPGACRLVTSLFVEGAMIAIGSSGPAENVELVCDELGINACLAARVTGADVVRGKPDPQVFLIAADRLSLPARQCVVIEDAPAGIEAASRAGMKSIALTSSFSAAVLGPASLTASQLSDITPHLVRTIINSTG